jgi:hypothetical protein
MPLGEVLSEEPPTYWESLIAGLTMTKEDWKAIRSLVLIILFVLTMIFFV